MRNLICSLVALLTVASSPAVSQTPTDVPAGTPLRFSYRALETEQFGPAARRFVARFVRAGGDTIYALDAANGDTLRLPIGHFARVEMAASRYHPIARGGIIGASLGLLAGAAYGGLHSVAPRFTCGDILQGCTHEKQIGGASGALRWGALGAVAGLGTGMAIGATMTRERWVVVAKWRT